MADRQTKIEIPDPVEGEAPATAEQLQFIRQLVEGMSLQGYRFDYRKLGKWQASAVIDQLLALKKEIDHTPPPKPRKQGPGCIVSLVRGTTTLVVWAIVLAGVAGGAYLIYWRMQQTKPPADEQQETAQADTPNTPRNNEPDRNSRESSIFSGLGTSDTPANDPPPRPDTPDGTPDTTPDPITPPTPTGPDPALLKQIAGLEELLVKLSQYTRNDFPQNIRVQSSEAMQRKLEDFDQAFAAIRAKDPALARRISSVIADFAAQSVDGTAVRDEIKAIRQALDTLRQGL